MALEVYSFTRQQVCAKYLCGTLLQLGGVMGWDVCGGGAACAVVPTCMYTHTPSPRCVAWISCHVIRPSYRYVYIRFAIHFQAQFMVLWVGMGGCWEQKMGHHAKLLAVITYLAELNGL